MCGIERLVDAGTAAAAALGAVGGGERAGDGRGHVRLSKRDQWRETALTVCARGRLLRRVDHEDVVLYLGDGRRLNCLVLLL
jgi:hypothetical protein